MSGGVTEFMQRRPMPVDRLEIRLRRRHLHEVLRGHIKGAVAADAEVDAGGPNQRLGTRLDQAGRGRRRGNGDLLGQPVALGGVEDGEPLEERDAVRLVSGLAGASLLVLGSEAVGIDDGGAAFALADIAAERERLAEGEPALAGEAMLDDGAPEDQDIDPRIAPAGCGVLRHGERRLDGRRAPGLDPGQTPGLQLADDLVGDFVVKARPVGAGARAAILSGHRGSPRRAPEASLPALNPSRKTRPHSHSIGGVAGSPRRWGCAGNEVPARGKAFPARLATPHFRYSQSKRHPSA
ncbi:hypothetical protein C7441_1328 [Pseudaminobacter salicylatoxidans]|uniref:Uncharacterized protein n=1 Tax=Pseudaminobacter salicylatoxidans TaxID=93369 RepID=A0A316BJN9_PSESE|nr:hypothetical protein C7441_1328 [Pseudaminobacter salicylatoxidans]